MPAIETLNSFGRWLVPYLGRLSVELGVLAVVVLAAILLLRVRSARLRHVFWGLVLAKPVATLLIASPFSLYWFLKPPALEPLPPVARRPAMTAPRPAAVPPVARYGRPPMTRTAPPPAPPWWRRLDGHGVAGGVWVAISSLLALRLVVGFAFVGFLRRSAGAQRDGPLARAALEAARALGMRRPVRVSISPVAHGPVLAGVIRPEILLPRELAASLPERQLRLIIAHESAHARRKDNLVLLVQRLAEVFLFFHPAVWLCGWAMRREAEAACDDAVLAAHADARREYAGSLVEVAAITRERRAGLTRRLLINTFAATETRFTQRVSRILEGRRRRMTLGVTVAALVALMTIGVLGLPTTAAPNPEEVTEKEGEKMAVAERPVRREGGKVWIEGMEQVNWGGSFFTREDSQARCLVEALRCAGRDVDYADVMGLSGAAFKLTMAPNLFVAEIHSEMGMDWPEIVRRVWGVDYDWQAISLSDEKNPGWREQLRQAAVESIGGGMPLFYMNGEWNLLVGYREDGSAFICKPYDGSEEGYRESETPGGPLGDAWFASVLRESGEPAGRRDSVIRSLQTAVRLSTRPAETDGNRLYGFAAYNAWIAALEQNREDASRHGNAFSYSQLQTSRQAAAGYLRDVAGELGEDAAGRLRAAADRYESIAERLDDEKGCVALPWDQSWTAENRAREADVLRKCLADEEAAVAEIRAALNALGEDVPEHLAQDGGGGALASERPQVLLEDAMADFKHLADNVAGHRIELCVRGADEDVYPQPYCYLTTMLIQMRAAGWEDMDLDSLAAVSGASAMFGYESGEFMPKYAFHRRDPNKLVAQATGYAGESARVNGAEEAWEFVKESVDSGRPVSGWHGEMMLLAGYQGAEDRADRKVFAMKDGDGYFAEWWDWDMFAEWVGRGQNLSRHSGRVEAQPERDVALRIMRDLVALSEGVPEHIQQAFPNATFGLAGIEAWAADCADMDKHEDWSMCHPENPQWTVRNSTAAYLARVAEDGVLGAEATAHVRPASEGYRAAYRSWQEAYGLVGYAAPDGSGKVKERRLAAADAVRRAAEHERAAIAELRLALEAEGLELSGPFAQDGGGRTAEAPQRVLLADVPLSGGDGDGYVRGIEVLLAHAGTPVSYERLMGLSGIAFIAQADTEHRWEGKVDVGWWPLDTWGLRMRLDFLSRAIGWEIREVGWANLTPEEAEAARKDLPAFYRAQIEPHVKRAIDAGRPVLAISDFGFVIAGYDDASGEPPVLGRCACETEPVMARPDTWPYGLIVLGDRTEPMDADAADVAALRYAVDLAHDRAGPHEERWRDRRFTGLKALAAWAALLRDADEPVEDRHHANMVGRLAGNRAAAAAFLRDVAARHGGRAVGPLRGAADSYESVVARLSECNWRGLVGNMEARRALADRVDRIAATELEAAQHIREALRALGEDVPEPLQQDGGGADPPGPGEAHMLEGLECAPFTSAELAAVMGALRYLGREVSPGWLYGATGHAFAINMRPTVCVSSPYAWDKTLYELAPNIGCRITGMAVSKQKAGDEFPARQREAWDMVRDAIDRGLPCYADRVSWMPDYSLITGYDDIGYYYTHANPDARGGPTPWQKLGMEDIEVLDVWRVELCDPAPDDEIVRAALQTVLQRAATPDGWTVMEGQRSGPAAFDLWADELELGHAKLDSHVWNAHFWQESRLMAVEFLKEAKERLPGRADAAFDEAIAHYSVVRDRLEEVKDLCPFRDNPDWGETLQSDEQARLIREAGGAERKGLEALREVLVALGGAPPGLSATGEQEGYPLRSGDARRFVLEGVRKVAYHTDRWRFTPFCNSLDACLQYLGEPEQYDHLMCTSGAAFRMTWTPHAWDGGNSDILGMAVETLEPMRRAFWSAGYEMLPVAKAEPDDWAEDLLHDAAERLDGELTDEAGFRRRIVQSIDRGRPVIAFGIIGPPEACVVTGYDERGDYLVGWNCFQDDEGVETDGAGRFRVRDWYPKTRGLLLFGDEVGRPDQEDLDRETLKWALQVLRARRVRNSHAGPDAFDAWAADMLNDEYFPEGDTGVLRGRLMCHWDSMTVTAFRGGGGATEYLEAAADRNPGMAEHLRAAADALEREDVVHGVAPGEEDRMERLADHGVRQRVAGSILNARVMHLWAADHIEKALRAAGVPEGDLFQADTGADPSPAGSAGNPGRRLVLEGVPKVSASGVEGHYALTPFPGCLQACLEYMDDDLGFEREGDYPRGAVYDYLMGATGAAFRLFWKPGWHGDNRSSWAFDNPEEYWRRGFAAAGYEYTSSGFVPESERKERLRPMAITSIRDLGRPAIGFGVLGPPCETIIAGYDEGGRVAVGWHYWQDHEAGQPGLEFEPNGYFRKRDWEEKATGMILIGDKTATPERRATYVEALQNALRLIREPMQGERHSGLAAYDAWAEHILRDEEVAPGGGPGDAYMAHADAADVIAEGRHCASCFLEQAAEVLPEAKDELLAASKCFAAEHDLIWKMWDIVSGWRSDEERQKFAKPDARRKIAPIIREARDKDAEAADHIEKALLALGVPPEDIPRGESTGLAQDGGGRAPAGEAGAAPERVVLEDIPKIGYGVIDPRVSTTPWPASLWACLEYMGDDLGFGVDEGEYPREAVYAYLTGTTGTAFRLVWAGWGLDNWASWMIYDDAGEIFRRGYAAIGYEQVSSGHVPDAEKAERFRGQVIESISRGRPLIAHGIVGPPEETIVAGYDEGGDVVIGWSAFQDTPWATPKADGFEPNGMFRKRNWEAHAHSMGAIGEKSATPDRRETYTEALRNALRIVRTPVRGNLCRGLAAYDAWAEHILRDDEIAAGTPDDAFDVHNTAVDMVAEGRLFASIFLRQAAGFLPEAKGELLAAADCYAAEHDLMQRISGIVGGSGGGEEQRQAFLKPDVRRRMIPIIQEARGRDAEAAAHIEKALLALGVPAADIPRAEPTALAQDGGGRAPAGEGGAAPERVVLEDVPRVGFGVIDGHVGMTPWPACLRACLEYMGDDLGFGVEEGRYPRDAVYAYLMGTTGAGFRLLWKPGWAGDNVCSFGTYDDAGEIFRRGFAAIGYDRAPWSHPADAEKAEQFRSQVIESINRGRPLIAHGIIGPPEEAIIAGYDEAGGVVIGWSFFQDRPEWSRGVEFEPNGMFRKRHWVADTWSMMAIGDKAEMPERRGAYIEALQNALHIVREPIRYDCYNGLAAYAAWAEHILRDDEVAAGGDPDGAFDVHSDAIDVVAEGRHYASVFLRQAADHLPEVTEDLLAAAECYKAEHDLMWEIWGIVGGNGRGEEQRQAFLKPDVRRRIVPIIRQARDRDAEAASHVERALLALGMPPEGIAPAEPSGASRVPRRASGKEMLDGLEFPHWTITHLGCMKGCLDYLGHEVPRAWLYGGTAHAFFINIHEDADLESVTAWDHGFVRDLAPNLGFRVDGLRAVKPELSEEEFRARQREAWGFVRRSILLNRPCYGWELKAPYGDFWLITGFDDVGYYYDGHETGGPTPWRKLGDQSIPVLNVRSVQPCDPALDEVVVREALVAALENSRPGWDSSLDGGAHFGPEAYDAWARALESGAALHNHHAYNAVAWHECREMAVEFLREAKRRLPARADAAFDEAIARYTVVRDRLAAVKELTPIDHSLGWGEEPKLQSPEAAALVRQAGAAERKGLLALAGIAKALGATPPDLSARQNLQQDGGGKSVPATAPRIETVDLKLVGVQAVTRVDQDFTEDMRALWRKLAARLDGIAHQSEPRRQIGHWHWVDATTRVYVMGVQVDTLEGFQWDYDYGLGAWAPGEVTFAMFRERNGEEGSVVRHAYDTLADMGYDHDPRFMGEFEVWPLDSIGPEGRTPEGEYHEVWIPVVRSAG